MKFEPWEKFKKDYEPEPIDVKKPPCPHCKHWKPVRLYAGGLADNTVMIFNGVRLCHAVDMFPNFSCYVDREEEILKSKKPKQQNKQDVITL